jgi:hypothetical protein
MRAQDSTGGPVTGAAVMTADGQRIGTVKAVSGNQFQVDAPLRPDFWLDIERIRDASAEQVVLDVNRDRLGEHKAEGHVEEDIAAGYKPAGVAPIGTDNDPGLQPSEYLAEAPSDLPDAVPGVRMGKPAWQEGVTASISTVTPSLNPSVVPIEPHAHSETAEPDDQRRNARSASSPTPDNDESVTL